MNIIAFSLFVSFEIMYMFWASKIIWKAFNDSDVSSGTNFFTKSLLFIVGWVFGIVVGPIIICTMYIQSIGGKK